MLLAIIYLPNSGREREGDTHQVEPLGLSQVLRRQGCAGAARRLVGLSDRQRVVELSQLLAPLQRRLFRAHLHWLHCLPCLDRSIVVPVCPHQYP